MASFELLISPSDLPGDDEEFNVFNFDSLEELEEALVDLTDMRISAEGITISFHPQPRPPFTIINAFGLLIDILENKLPPQTKVCCKFQTAEAASHAARRLPKKTMVPRKKGVDGVDVGILLGEITQVFADAIVNASNTRLILGNGVSGAIKRAVANSRGLQAALKAKAPISSGGVVVTDSFGLPMIPKILHAATASGDANTIKIAVKNVLAACRTWKLKHVALPALGCGTGGLSPRQCASIMYEEVKSHCAMGAIPSDMFPERITIVLYDEDSFQVFAEIFGAK